MRCHATLCFYSCAQAVLSYDRTSSVRRLSATAVEASVEASASATASYVMIEQATPADIEAIQQCNRASLPENYADCFYERHFSTWPGLSFVARSPESYEDVVGYVLGRLEDAAVEANCGHVTSLAVAEAFRRRGVARGLMAAVHSAMARGYGVDKTRLHVRSSNRSALRLYSSLGYTIHSVHKSYYADGESAYLMAAKLFSDNKALNGFNKPLLSSQKKNNAFPASLAHHDNPNVVKAKVDDLHALTPANLSR
mmetsp:Transcript_8987/g.29165  ORF Transcript_8987/g.29165 Transcript_8987/m.29165 type:complete len:254 (-) Transcript_8987:473-1234(-)|eukprot:CAMPEP_0118896780 /NCGR_PEP_ID=MMETSP1166-20130328/4476_1 /TAXON_ID=1104430 /ORGANISM="Chrysoreinhardia sp, Strain CCMP3193" /LENGTH=253 /DNA_ID=CAMNT_0006835839 /DNA_START=231 /DNA_END=992 /DNA_ORIENTATION=+